MNKLSPQRAIIGLLIILVGVALLLDSLGFGIVGEILGKVWPAILVVVGILMLLNDRSNYLWALLIIVVGNVLLLNTTGILEVSIWRLVWPALIIIVGVSIMMNRAATSRNDAVDEQVSREERDNVVAILSGSEQRNHSQDFRAGKVTAVLGGVVYDLRKAVIKKDATVEIFALWGGVELIVPETVTVQCSTLNILGGVENKSVRPASEDAPVLRIVGDVIMAGVEIKN